jgi:hypothetical protein
VRFVFGFCRFNFRRRGRIQFSGFCCQGVPSGAARDLPQFA